MIKGGLSRLRPLWLTLVLLASFSAPFSVDTARAAPQQSISFQARILSKDRTQAPTGSFPFRFSLYSAPSGGSPAWSESWTGGNELAVRYGLFNVSLGSQNSLTSLDWSNTSYWLGIEFDSDKNGSFEQAFVGRVPLSAAPYALAAKTITDTLEISKGGTGASTASQAMKNLLPSQSGQSGKALVSNGTDASWQNISGAPDASYLTLGTHSGLDNERVLIGTTNQITITDQGAGNNVVLSLPQDIATSSNVNFNRLALGSQGYNGNSSDILYFDDPSSNRSISINSSGQLAFVGDSATNSSYRSSVHGDTTERFTIKADGDLSWGNGSSSRDTTLGRVGTSQLKITGDTSQFLTLSRVNSGVSGDMTLGIGTQNSPTFQYLNGGLLTGENIGTATYSNPMLMEFRPAASEFNIKRMAVSAGSSFTSADASTVMSLVNGQLRLPLNGSDAGLKIGDDTNLYRSAANALKTDDQLLVGGGAALSLASGISLGVNGHAILNSSDASGVALYIDATNDSGSQYKIVSTGSTASWGGQFAGAGKLAITGASQVWLWLDAAGDKIVINSDLEVVKNAKLLAQGDLRLYDSDSTNYVGFQSASTVGTDVVWTLPSSDSSGCLSSNGSGTLGWSACAGGSGAPTGAQYLTLALDSGLSAERVLVGTTNQISLSDGGANGNLTLSTPQNIHTAATPQFAKLGLGQAANTYQLSLPAATLATGGIDFGGDTNLYRASSAALATQYSAANNGGPNFVFRKSRGSIGAESIVNISDTIGSLAFQGFDGSSWTNLASISAAVGDTPGLGDMPGIIIFKTTPDSSSTPTEGLRIDQDQKLWIGGSVDTNLYRSASNLLRTDDTLYGYAGILAGDSATVETDRLGFLYEYVTSASDYYGLISQVINSGTGDSVGIMGSSYIVNSDAGGDGIGVYGNVRGSDNDGSSVTTARALYGQNTMGFVPVATSYAAYLDNPTGSAITSNYGLYIADQTAGTSTDYGVAIAGADTQALWISSGADNTDTANGIAFGASRDAAIYRSDVGTLRTDNTALFLQRTGAAAATFRRDESSRAAALLRASNTATDNTAISLRLYDSTNANEEYGFIGAAIVDPTNTSEQGAVIFGVRSGSEAAVEKMRLNYDGKLYLGSNIGIDTNLYRGAANEVTTDDLFAFSSSKTISATDFKTYKADGSGGIGFIFDTSSTYSTSSLLSIRNNSSAKLSLSQSGDLTIAGTLTQSGTPADIAENIAVSDQSISAGDIVAADSSSNETARKATSDDDRILGVISTDPGVLISGGTNGKPLALAGRIPVKVLAGSRIKIGDTVVVSTTPGIGTKATDKVRPMVGIAISNQDSSNLVTVQLQPGVFVPGLGVTNTTAALSPQQSSIIDAISLLGDGTLKVNSLAVDRLSVSNDLLVAGTITVNGNAKLGSLELPAEVSATAMIKAGDKEAHITTSQIRNGDRVLLTPHFDINRPTTPGLNRGDITDGQGFNVHIDTPITTDLYFDWLIIH